MKDAESYKVLMFLNRPSHLRPWWPDKHPDSILGWHSVEGLHLARGCTLMEDIPFSISGLQTNGLGEGILLHGLPGHHI